MKSIHIRRAAITGLMALSAHLGVPTTAHASCTECDHVNVYQITGDGDGTIQWNMLDGTIICISGGAKKKNYTGYPQCNPSDYEMTCHPDGATISVAVTTYTCYSATCQPPNWQLDPEAPPTEDVPDCYNTDGCSE